MKQLRYFLFHVITIDKKNNLPNHITTSYSVIYLLL